MALLELVDVKKSYRTPAGAVRPVLDVPTLTLEEREEVALAGESGSGKTTLLNVVAGIQRPDGGEVRFDGVDLAALPEARRDRFRAENVGYVFQSFNLLQGYTALENVVLGMNFGPGPDRGHARELLEHLGLGDRLDDRPRQLSVGQQQRVAVARALANRPRLVLADEPTGNLDARRAMEALELLRRACREEGAALLLVSHDERVLARFDRVLRLDEINRVAAGEDEA